MSANTAANSLTAIVYGRGKLLTDDRLARDHPRLCLRYAIVGLHEFTLASILWNLNGMAAGWLWKRHSVEEERRPRPRGFPDLYPKLGSSLPPRSLAAVL